ncbi:hypothetical protein BVRB_8g189950 [Beta vulgaris subsp. vulgaris]|nr:hypothetical protein BVRB_8g189950 [Beta vulgaris subsp. vulgaris]
MASSRVARIAIEVAPPQFVNIMKFRRTSNKALDTIYEDQEKEMNNSNSFISSNLKNHSNIASSSIMSKYFSPRN